MCEKQYQRSGCDFLTHLQAKLEASLVIFVATVRSCCVYRRYGKESISFLYLLSNNLRIVTGLDFKCAVIRPEIHRVGYAGDTSFVYLKYVSKSGNLHGRRVYQLCSFGTSNRKF